MNTIEQNLVKTAGRYVTTEHVDSLIRNYKKDRWMQNSERLGKEDTLNLWLTLDELEEFIQTSRMNGADGVRVCFGVYGGDAQAPHQNMVGKQTVAFVATASDEYTDRDVYVEKDGQSSILAYNMIYFPPGPTVPPPPALALGSLMVADKDKGLQVI